MLYPAVAYPTYAMGADARRLPGRAGARSTTDWRLDLDADRPGRRRPGAVPVGQHARATRPAALDDLGAAAAWGRAHGVPVLSATSATSSSPGTGRAPHRSSSTALDGVLAVHSLSKRSNLAGVRVGFYAGDPELVHYLERGAQARRVHGARARCRPPPSPRWATTTHVDEQRAATCAASSAFAEHPGRASASTPRMPGGGFYLWAPAPDGDAWALSRRLAAEARRPGVSPGEFYGPAGAGHVRVAVVQPDDRLELVARRLGVA